MAERGEMSDSDSECERLRSESIMRKRPSLLQKKLKKASLSSAESFIRKASP